MTIKPCKYCKQRTHFPYQCSLNPKPKKPIKRIGKRAKEWSKIRQDWLDRHPEPYFCYICGKRLQLNNVSIDHLIPRSNAKNYANRHDDENLRPCCINCNIIKGSRH